MVSFQLTEKKIHQILVSEFTYEIPKFQREYSWEKDEINQFLEDIFLMMERINDFNNIDEDYFLGSLVVIEDPKDAKNRIVIDGQQRLTTIMILLNVLKEKFKIPPNKKDIQRYLYADIQKEKYRLKLNRTNREFFTRFIQSFNSDVHKERLNKELKASSNSNKLIFKAYEQLSKQIEERIKEKKIEKKERENFLLKILNTLKDSFTVVEMSATTIQDSSLIFETLNTRSKKLQLYELIKNHIFGRMKTKKEDIEGFWSKILEKYYEGLSRNFSSSFTTNYSLIKGDNAIFYHFIKNFKEINELDSKKTYYEYSLNLRQDIEILYNMKKPTIEFFKKEKYVKDLSLIRSFKVEQAYWVLLASYKKEFQFEKILSIIKRFIFKNKFSKNLPYNSRPILARIANKIILGDYSNTEHLEDIKKQLDSLSSSLEKIKINFLEDSLSNTLLKTLMLELNKEDNSKLKLEHIYSKNNSSSNFRKKFKAINKKRKFEINSIGNCTLLTTKGNREASDKDFDEKIKIYDREKEKIISTNKKLCELYKKYNEFNNNLLEEYEQFIWEKISELFNLEN